MHKDPHQRPLSYSTDMILRRHRLQSRLLDHRLAWHQIQLHPQDDRSNPERLHRRTLHPAPCPQQEEHYHPQKARRIASRLPALPRQCLPGLTSLPGPSLRETDHTYTFAMLTPCLTLAKLPPCPLQDFTSNVPWLKREDRVQDQVAPTTKRNKRLNILNARVWIGKFDHTK
jgi:hypothetical protein